MAAVCSSSSVNVKSKGLRGWCTSKTTRSRSLAPGPHRRRVASSAPRGFQNDTDSSADPMLIIIECDGVLCDVHLDGHREAFNEAFTVGLYTLHPVDP